MVNKYRQGKYVTIGVVLTLFNYGVYTFIARVIMKDNDLLWLSTLISTLLTTVVAYILHSHVTWKDRYPGKTGVYKFFVWNVVEAVAINPGLTWFFGLAGWLYEFAYSISSNIGLPFDYDFVQSTGAFALTGVVTMILNYLFYDKFVFGKKEEQKTDVAKDYH